ncbi:MAG: hypothetical protein NTW52_19205 [Planctomycetota bacterium]|nr:hypothetical protein [Planctomycetota bacterium]
MRKKSEESSFLCFIDAQGRYAQFQALRETFIANLLKSGISPKMAQSLARHSDIVLTMNVYTGAVLVDQAMAVELLLAQLPQVDFRGFFSGCVESGLAAITS